MYNWIIIMSFTYSHEAHLAKNYLESFGIETSLRDEMTSQIQYLSNAVGGVKLLVKDYDYDKSIGLLMDGGYLIEDNSPANNTGEIILIDNPAITKICPFCSSDNIGKQKIPNKVTLIVYLILGLISPIFRSSYKCFNCEKEWRYKY